MKLGHSRPALRPDDIGQGERRHGLPIAYQIDDRLSLFAGAASEVGQSRRRAEAQMLQQARPANVDALGWATSQTRLTDPAVAAGALEKFLKESGDGEVADAVRDRLAKLLEHEGNAAGAERQDGFRALFWAWSAGLFVVVGFFRRRALTDLVNQIKEKADGQE